VEQPLSEIQQQLEGIRADQALILSILSRMANPAMTLSVNEKATAIKKALRSGDKAVIRQTMKEINGYAR